MKFQPISPISCPSTNHLHSTGVGNWWNFTQTYTKKFISIYFSVTSPGTVCDALHEVPTAEWRQVVDAGDKYGDEFGQKDVVIAERYYPWGKTYPTWVACLVGTMREWKASRVRLTMPTDFPQLKVKADLRVRKSYCASWAFSKTWCSLSVCFREVLRWLLHLGRYKIWYTTTRGVPIWGEQRFEPFQPKTSRSKLFSWAYMQFLLSFCFQMLQSNHVCLIFRLFAN